MLIPAVVAGRHGGDKLEVSVSRCVHAVGLCQKSAIREGLERKQLLFGGFGERGILKGIIWERLLIHSCHLSVMMALKGWLQRLMNGIYVYTPVTHKQKQIPLNMFLMAFEVHSIYGTKYWKDVWFSTYLYEKLARSGICSDEQ